MLGEKAVRRKLSPISSATELKRERNISSLIESIFLSAARLSLLLIRQYRKNHIHRLHRLTQTQAKGRQPPHRAFSSHLVRLQARL